MLRGLSPDLRDKIVNTYSDLVKEEREETQKAIAEKFPDLVAAHAAQAEKDAKAREIKGETTETKGKPEMPSATETMRRAQEIADTLQRAPQRVQVIDAESSALDKDAAKLK